MNELKAPAGKRRCMSPCEHAPLNCGVLTANAVMNRFKRCTPRYSVRTLLFVITAVCVVLVWQVDRAKKQEASVRHLQAAGNWIIYGFQTAPNRNAVKLSNSFGIDIFHRVDSAIIHQELTAQDLTHLNSLSGLRHVTITPKLTDAMTGNLLQLRRDVGISLWADPTNSPHVVVLQQQRDAGSVTAHGWR